MSLTIEDVRQYLVDRVEDNFLLDEEEMSSERIQKAIKFTVAKFNETPVLTSYSPDTFPFISMLLDGVCAWLYRGQAAHASRNDLAYSTSGVTVDDTGNAAEYSAFAQQFEADFQNKARQIKNQINLEQGWGSVSSEYINVDRRR